ncbi:MAG: patatin family protein [Desulfuromonadales bacterium]|nr:patatin family protein [Desulfuromonadales bacterium]
MTGELRQSTIFPRGDARIGLAMGSGSARGLAHLGVIRALEEAGIRVDFVAGTSIGALIGAIYAAGKLNELETTFQDFDWKKIASFFDVVFPRSGLIDGAKVSELVRAHIRADTIEALPIPFCAVATDIQTGEEVAIRQGDVIEAVRASISVPGIFTPVRSNGRILADGGLTNPVPVSVVRAMGADIVIAVDLNHDIIAGKNLKTRRLNMSATQFPAETGVFSHWVDDYRQSMQELKAKLIALEAPGAAQFSRWFSSGEPLPNIFEVLLASINIIETRITQSRLDTDRPDILIQPPLGHIRFLDFGRAAEIIEIGYESVRGKIDVIQKKLQEL